MDDDKNTVGNYLKIKRDLQPVFDGYNTIKAIYLFGSTVTGGARTDSDIDIAVRCMDNMPPEHCFELLLNLLDPLENYFGRKVDVVMLNTASLKMIRQVLRHGILLYAQDPEKEIEYAIHKQKEYFDFQYFMNIDRLELKTYFGAT
ncbi:MAG: nucleotidyltransferase domain-containing protein [Pseudomonadota bacterium]